MRMFNPWPRSVRQGSGIGVSSGAGHRLDLDLVLLWCRPAAIPPILPLAWEHAYAVGAAKKKNKKNQ